MNLFMEKKEADLSRKKNSRTPGGSGGGKKPSTDRKGKGKVNGNHTENKSEDGVVVAENGEKEESPEAE